MQKVEFKKIPQLDFRTNEAFKTLRTNITFCGDDQRVILFTSTIPNEGKTSVVFQLARSFAEDGKRVDHGLGAAKNRGRGKSPHSAFQSKCEKEYGTRRTGGRDRGGRHYHSAVFDE